MMIQYKIYKN